MRISKFGHACLLVEEGGARILIDPGVFSKGFEDLVELDAILITHQHRDHMAPDNIKALLETNEGAKVYADAGSAELLQKAGVDTQTVKAGDALDVEGVTVTVVGEEHAVIHPDIPGIPNVGYLIAEAFFYPGDSFTEPGRSVDVLAVPLGAPWMKASEMVDYVRAVKPRVAIPVHDAVLAMPEMHVGMIERLVPGAEVRFVKDGESTEI